MQQDKQTNIHNNHTVTTQRTKITRKENLSPQWHILPKVCVYNKQRDLPHPTAPSPSVAPTPSLRDVVPALTEPAALSEQSGAKDMSQFEASCGGRYRCTRNVMLQEVQQSHTCWLKTNDELVKLSYQNRITHTNTQSKAKLTYYTSLRLVHSSHTIPGHTFYILCCTMNRHISTLTE